MEKKDLKVGQVLYNWDLREFIVSKISNKYFECKDYPRGKFVIETLTFYAPEYTQSQFQLYADKQSLLVEKKTGKLTSEIRKAFGSYGEVKLSFKQLIFISYIIKGIFPPVTTEEKIRYQLSQGKGIGAKIKELLDEIHKSGLFTEEDFKQQDKPKTFCDYCKTGYDSDHSLLQEIENQMERWHLARDNDKETLEAINDAFAKVGLLSFFNK
jgi:hypothetical protein